MDFFFFYSVWLFVLSVHILVTLIWKQVQWRHSSLCSCLSAYIFICTLLNVKKEWSSAGRRTYNWQRCPIGTYMGLNVNNVITNMLLYLWLPICTTSEAREEMRRKRGKLKKKKRKGRGLKNRHESCNSLVMDRGKSLWESWVSPPLTCSALSRGGRWRKYRKSLRFKSLSSTCALQDPQQ